MPAKVRRDERRLRMTPEEAIALGHQLLERRVRRRREPSVAEERQLEPALVLVVDRLEELLRIGGVDEDRNIEPCGGLPDRIELRIVELQARPVALACVEAEALVDLADAERAGLDVGLELLRRALTEPGANVGEVDVRELHHPILVLAGPQSLHRLHEPVARHAAGVDQHLKIERIHRRDDGRSNAADRRRLMAVKVDDRILGARDRMLRDDERRPRLVVEDAGCRKFRARDRRRDDCEWRPGSAALRRLGNTQRGCGNDGQHQNDDSAEHVGNCALLFGIWDLGFGVWGKKRRSRSISRVLFRRRALRRFGETIIPLGP